MGRTSITIGTPGSSAGIMDGSVIGTYRFGKEPDRSSSFDVEQIGQPLSRHEAPAPTLRHQRDTQEAEEEIASGQLWFDLPLDERAQFGNCFSRMLLKCLRDVEQQEQEVKQ